jgi:hypothetical protein
MGLFQREEGEEKRVIVVVKYITSAEKGIRKCTES